MRRLLVSVALVSLLATPVAARGEWYDHYEDGVEAIARGDHAGAVADLQRALQLKSRSGYLRTYGNHYLRYAPHYQLGVALHGTGDCHAAKASFATSRSHGEADDDAELAEHLAALDAACDAALAPPPEEPAPVPAPPPIDRALLERGLQSYLAGEFAESGDLFESLAGRHPEAARLHLLAGMAFHGAWTAGGESQAALGERARAALAEAARLDPGLVPDPALCPPRVAALFRSLR